MRGRDLVLELFYVYQAVVCRSFLKVTDDYDGNKFFTIIEGNVKRATPLLLVLAVIEISDVVFAVDSIPAVSSDRWQVATVETVDLWHAFNMSDAIARDRIVTILTILNVVLCI